jgi:hypothetical protein
MRKKHMASPACRAVGCALLVLPALRAGAQTTGAVVLEQVAVDVAGVTIKVPKGWTDLTPSFAASTQRDYEHGPTRIITSVSRSSKPAEGMAWAVAEAKRVHRRDPIEQAEVAPGRYQLVLPAMSGDQAVIVYAKAGGGHVKALCAGPSNRLATLREICASMKAK